MRVLRAEIDGHDAKADELWYPALVNYGHFTGMQVRNRAVRGLDRHLDRLDTATRELFGVGMDRDLVRRHIRHALGPEIGNASVRVSFFRPDPGAGPSVMVTVSPPAEPPGMPQRLQSVIYQRPMAHIKHTGTFGLIHYGLMAERHGFDDALFTRDDGTVTEGAIANIAGYRDGVVTWPDALVLHGITMQLLEDALPAACHHAAGRPGLVRHGVLDQCDRDLPGRPGRRAGPAGGYGNHENGLGDLSAHRLAAALTSPYGHQRPITRTG